MSLPEMPGEVAAAYAGFPEAPRAGCLALRALLFDVADKTSEAGRVSEELRWGQPAYLTPDTRAGSTIRIGVPKSGGYALFLHCQTTLIEEFRSMAPKGMRFDGRRAVLFDEGESPDRAALSVLIRSALTYHLR